MASGHISPGELAIPDHSPWSNFAFVVLRDFYGTTQLVVETEEMMQIIKDINKESTIQVTGLVREITGGQVEFDAKVLRNGTEDKYESLDFNDGDDFFMAFTAPVDGYLSVYMYDGKVVYCMLPYKAQTDGLFKVGGGVRYILFSKRDTDESFPAYLVDEMEVFATNEVEFNRLYVIFSPSMFIKAQDSSIEEDLPRQLDFKSFQQWLFKLRKRDRSMTVKFFDITIKK